MNIIHSLVYFERMQVGKEYRLAIKISKAKDQDTRIISSYIERDEDEIGEIYELIRSEQIISSFFVRVYSPFLTITPSYRKAILINDKDEYVYKFRAVPNYSGKISITLEFLKDGQIFFTRNVRIRVQDKGIVIGKYQISNTLVKFVEFSCISLLGMIFTFFDFFGEFIAINKLGIILLIIVVMIFMLIIFLINIQSNDISIIQKVLKLDESTGFFVFKEIPIPID